MISLYHKQHGAVGGIGDKESTRMSTSQRLYNIPVAAFYSYQVFVHYVFHIVMAMHLDIYLHQLSVMKCYIHT
jgi:hypothetical protein